MNIVPIENLADKTINSSSPSAISCPDTARASAPTSHIQPKPQENITKIINFFLTLARVVQLQSTKLSNQVESLSLSLYQTRAIFSFKILVRTGNTDISWPLGSSIKQFTSRIGIATLILLCLHL